MKVVNNTIQLETVEEVESLIDIVIKYGEQNINEQEKAILKEFYNTLDTAYHYLLLN